MKSKSKKVIVVGTGSIALKHVKNLNKLGYEIHIVSKRYKNFQNFKNKINKKIFFL